MATKLSLNESISDFTHVLVLSAEDIKTAGDCTNCFRSTSAGGV